MHLFRRRHLFLIVWAVSNSTSAIGRTPDSFPHIQVSLFDDARVSRGTLAKAEARASAIFARAGIDVDWLACAQRDPADFAPSSSLCSDLSWPTRLSVRIIPRGRSIASDVFGQAFVDDSGQGVYSNVYYENLALSPNHPGVSDGDMLGYVLAHEIGHLLLGTNSHADSGLMQAHWRDAALHAAAERALFFTTAQSALLRSRLSAARAAQTASNQVQVGKGIQQ